MRNPFQQQAGTVGTRASGVGFRASLRYRAVVNVLNLGLRKFGTAEAKLCDLLNEPQNEHSIYRRIVASDFCENQRILGLEQRAVSVAALWMRMWYWQWQRLR
jgi:hypothetical protein